MGIKNLMVIEEKVAGDPAPPQEVTLPTDIAAALATAPGSLTQSDRDTLLLAVARAVLRI